MPSASDRFREFTIDLAVIAVAALVALVACELAVRLFIPEPAAETNGLFMQHDPVLGWRKVPGMTGIYRTDEFQAKMKINSRSSRGPVFPYARTGDAYRIVVLGDSFAEGYTVDFDELFSEVMRRRLEKVVERPIEVINLGTAGYSTDQELLVFRNEGRRYEPDLTILMFFENDVWFNSQEEYYRGYKPVFRLRDGNLQLDNVPVPMPEADESPSLYEHIENRGLLDTLHGILRDRSALYRFVVRRIRNSSYFSAVTEDVHLKDELRVWRKMPDDEFRNAWEVTRRLISSLRDDAEAAGSRLVIFYVPNKASVYPDTWEATKARYGLDDQDWSPDRASEELMILCASLDIECMATISDFVMEAKRLAREDKVLYFRTDPHWNANGHALAGELLAEFVADEVFPAQAEVAITSD